MAEPQDETETELELEFFISHILRFGVLFAAAVIGFGVLLWVLKGSSGYSDSTYPIILATIVRDAVALRPLAVIQMGLLFLVLTPVVRVAASLFLFGRGRDWTYVVITGIVLTLLLISLFLGSGE
jgi:uncharacterized membrane protein